MIVRDVVARAACIYGTNPGRIFSRDRSFDVALARQIIMYLIFMDGEMTNIRIGELFRRSPATVTHAVNMIGQRVAEDEDFEQRVRLIRFGNLCQLTILQELDEAVSICERLAVEMKPFLKEAK